MYPSAVGLIAALPAVNPVIRNESLIYYQRNATQQGELRLLHLDGAALTSFVGCPPRRGALSIVRFVT